MNRLVPLGPNRCLYDRYVYKHAGADDQEMEELQDASSRTVEEDREVCVAVQAGLESGAVRFGRTMPESETAVRHFHRLVWDSLAPAFEGS
jgi:choline monooxygenase